MFFNKVYWRNEKNYYQKSLNQFEMFSIYATLLEILELWRATLQMDVTNKNS